MSWDPLGTWSRERRWVWPTLAFWIIVLRGPAYLENLRTPSETVPDFFQEWASARNYYEGLPIYTTHRVTVPRYLGITMQQTPAQIVVNAHPPTSVLLALPFAKMNFRDAFLIWNLVSLVPLAASLWVVKTQLKIRLSIWALAPLVTLLVLCNPLWQQFRYGQLNLFLLILVTGAWAAERSGRPLLAGTLLGAATAIKLFPGFLLVYYALRGQGKVVAAGMVALTVLTGLTAAMLGIETYRVYIGEVMPTIQWFRVGWNNNSLFGFWSRLFDPAPEMIRQNSRSESLWYSPALARIGYGACAAIVMAIVVWAAWKARSLPERDLGFGLATTAMLLVSPIAWEHYLVLLLVPLAVSWLALPPSRAMRAFFGLVVVAFWINPMLVFKVFDLTGHVARPIDNLTVVPFQCYALLGLVALEVAELNHEARCAMSRSAGSHQTG